MQANRFGDCHASSRNHGRVYVTHIHLVAGQQTGDSQAGYPQEIGVGREGGHGCAADKDPNDRHKSAEGPG